VDTYDGAADDLIAILRNATVTMDTVTDQRAQLAGFLADTTELADTARGFLDRNGDRVIQLGQVTRPVLELLAAYAPEYPCLLEGVVALQPRAEQAFTSGAMHVTLEITKDRGKYVAGRDDPVYAAHDGPNCRGLPGPAVPFPGASVNDGYGAPASMGLAGTAEERAVVKPILAAATGMRVDQVPDVAGAAVGSAAARNGGERHMKIGAPLTKLLIFAAVTLTLTALLAQTLGSLGLGGGTRYRAYFTDVTGLLVGDDVRIAGVRVGRIEKIGLAPDQRSVAEVAFTVDSDVPLATSVRAKIRYRKPGRAALRRPQRGPGRRRPPRPGGLIPLAQTTPRSI
jgi:ABC-type transporter Mla subunit MlaD